MINIPLALVALENLALSCDTELWCGAKKRHLLVSQGNLVYVRTYLLLTRYREFVPRLSFRLGVEVILLTEVHT